MNTPEETYLTPGGTTIRFKAWVMDYEHLFKPLYGEYRAILQIANANDYHHFTELGDRCIMEVEMRRDPLGSKSPKNAYQTDKGYAIASQLFPPRININEDERHILDRQTVSIAGHFRDAPDGLIYFQLDYLDVVEELYDDVFPVTHDDVDDDDW